MKKLLSILSIFLACSTTKGRFNDPNTEEQVFISDQTKGEPGKCYTKVWLDEEVRWVEVLCENEITKQVIGQIQGDLQRLGYLVEQAEINNGQMGDTTKKGLRQFQKSQKLAVGVLDWATINRLRNL